MRVIPLLFFILALTVSCGTGTSSELKLEEIRLRLEVNQCRLVLENARYRVMSWEYDHGERIVTGDELRAALPESLVVCPVTLEPYILETGPDARYLTCPVGHESVELMEE